MGKMGYEKTRGTFELAAEEIYRDYLRRESRDFMPLREVCENWFDGHELGLVCTLEILDIPAAGESPEWPSKGDYLKVGAWRMAEYLDSVYSIYDPVGWELECDESLGELS